MQWYPVEPITAYCWSPGRAFVYWEILEEDAACYISFPHHHIQERGTDRQSLPALLLHRYEIHRRGFSPQISWLCILSGRAAYARVGPLVAAKIGERLTLPPVSAVDEHTAQLESMEEPPYE